MSNDADEAEVDIDDGVSLVEDCVWYRSCGN